MTEEPSEFEELLADPTEQFDKRSELLASIEAYSKAVPATAGFTPRQPTDGQGSGTTRVERAIRREVAEEIAQALLDFEANDIRGRADMSIDRAVAICREIGSKEPASIFQAIADPSAVERCPVRGYGDQWCMRPAQHDGKHEWAETP